MKTGHLLRMRQSGWFDVLVLVLTAALVFCGLGLGGLISHARTTASLPPNATPYEIQQAYGALASGYGTYLTLGFLLGAFALLGLLGLRFVSPFIARHEGLHRASAKGRVALQVAGAVLITLIMLFPMYWMVVSSLKSSEELLLAVPTLWPHVLRWDNYVNVLRRAPFGLYFFNTVVSTFLMMLGELVLGVSAAYGFSKGQFKGKNALFLLVLGALMVPIQVTFVPIYVMVARLGWLNTFAGLVVPNLVSAYFIFMLRQTFLTVDDSYLEAGKVDGMGRIGSIFHVLMPMCAPTLITISIITFINGWNNYFWPRMVAPLEARRTLAVGIVFLRRTFAGIVTSNYNEIMAGAVLGILPIVVLFLVMQKYIMTGMSKAAMK
ncbi:MAG TPA: carbohydrate ABC transporter permease [Clostridia bacterium]|nr:carbohydrate ABC transporter permease [Clostridia bacterium]